MEMSQGGPHRMQLHPRIAEERPKSSDGHTPGSTLLQRSAVAARFGRMLQVLKELLCHTGTLLS